MGKCHKWETELRYSGWRRWAGVMACDRRLDLGEK